MALRIETPGPTVRQVSGKDPEGRYILSVLVKRTYSIAGGKEWAPAGEQSPLCEEPEFDSKEPDILVQDCDLFPFKPRCDVVVAGHAQGYTGRRQFHAEVRVGASAKKILVQGERRAALTAAGGLVFSTPEPVDRIPLSWTHAYGGRDTVAEAEAVSEVAARAPAIPPEVLPTSDSSPFAYPRNPCGRGFLISATSQAVEKLQLPNLEDPLDPLTPDRLAVGSTLRWPRMPLPQGTGWVSYDWFPRMVGIGLLPLYEKTETPFPEVARGYIPEGVLRPARYDQADPFHLTCGASLGLQVPLLRGGEPVVLESLHGTEQAWSFRLPSERPRIWTDGRKGKLNATEPVIQTVVIEPDASRLTIVWRGAAMALRPYLDQELAKMPFRVEW
jgi:hypothetical protein